MQILGKYRCINCFNELNTENEICSCGYDITQYKSAMHRLAPGTVLDNRYYIGRVIGEGGFGITYVGYDANLEIRVAIKEFFLNGINTRNTTYSDELESSAEEKEKLFETYREKFINEARVLGKFNNEDGIVTVHNFFKANNTAYIIMEFLDGQDLKSYLKTKWKLTADEVIEIFLPIMRTLDKVHNAKLIHRDISPDNIIFTTNGKVKLLDFGAARDVSDDNKSLSVVLKHGYAPPEQYQTHGKQGPWTDVYALSATIYKCLTGNTPNEAMDRTLGEELAPVYAIVPDCPKSISDVIMKGLEVKITDRYQTMGEMAEELKKAQNGENIIEQKVNEPDTEATVLIVDDAEKKSTVNEPNNDNVPIQKSKSSNKKPLVLVLAAVVFGVVAGLTVMFLGKSGYRQKGEDAQAIAAGTEEEKNDGYLEDTVESTSEEIVVNTPEEESPEESPYAYLKSAQVGDIVEFGNYNGFTTWRVLAKDDTKLMLITENVIDRQPFNTENVECDWSSCTLRTWLNEDYYNSAFTDEEKSLIKESIIDEGKDKIFLLSLEEAIPYFKNDDDRIAHNTEYEKENGVEAPYGFSWWLRSPVYDYDNYYGGSYIGIGGNIFEGFNGVNYIDIGIRPALNIDISNL